MYLENNLIVEVVDSSGTPLKEWGQQKFGDKRLSCYVQSETGMSFGLRLVPAASIRSEVCTCVNTFECPKLRSSFIKTLIRSRWTTAERRPRDGTARTRKTKR